MFWICNQSEKIKSKNEKNYIDSAIYFTRYDRGTSVRMLSLHYHELVEKIEEYEGNVWCLKHLMLGSYMLDKVLNTIKEIIGITRFDDIKKLTGIDKLTEDINLEIFDIKI